MNLERHDFYSPIGKIYTRLIKRVFYLNDAWKT